MVSRMPTHDAIVIGGGPAGSVAGWWLARAGWRVAVLERGPRERDKACGHCLGPRGVALLRRLGLRPPLTLLGRDEAFLRFHHEAGATVAAPYVDPRGRGSAALVRRSEFDQWLLDAAGAEGAEVLQPASAVVERLDAGDVTLAVRTGEGRMPMSARVVIGADGIGSAVARTLGMADATAGGRKYGFSFDVPAGADRGAAPETPRGVELFVVDGGYLGLARERDGTLHAAGLVGTAGGPRDPVGFTRSVAAKFAPLRDLGLDRIEADAVRRLVATSPMPWRPRRVATDRGALVGDAAGYVEPFTGEGMTWALHGAALLGEVLVAAGPAGWSLAAARAYTRRHHRLVRRRQRVCRWVTGTLDRRRWCRTLFRSAARHPRLVSPLVRRVLST
jgi:flavin-dependent dehydrogenase